MRVKKIYNLFILFVISIFSSCSYVHEWPEVSTKVPFYIHLTYDTEMIVWEHIYDGTLVQEVAKEEPIRSEREKGYIRYIIRAYPIVSTASLTTQNVKEFIFVRNVEDGYDFETMIELEQGDYNILVWSDLIEYEDDMLFYNVDNFYEIKLQSEQHRACTDYRDAFSGSVPVSLVADVYEKDPEIFEIKMKRPLAKFEFISDDIQEFIAKETTRIQKENIFGSTVENISFEDYIVTIYYVGFMPNTYSLFTDKPTDAVTGVLFRSNIQQLSKLEASLGFDYVFVKDDISAITVQLSIANKKGEVLSTSIPINIPLNRNYHTIIKGKFLTSDAAGGVAINPDYDGEFNLIYP